MRLTDSQISSGECVAMAIFHLKYVLHQAAAGEASSTTTGITTPVEHFDEAIALIQRAKEKYDSGRNKG